MKANELRIGNYVMGNSPYRIGISQMVTMDWYDKTHKDSYCEPIPLTEEWLVKFRFESNGSQFWYKSYDYTVDTRGNKFVVHSDYSTPSYGTEVKYVHQLQNLYYALTGEELVAEPARTTTTIN